MKTREEKLEQALKDVKLDCEKVIQNLVNTGCDEAWSIVKLNNMIQDVDDSLKPECLNCHGDGYLLDTDDNELPCPECP